jgi:putative addiction module CopG family antidote
MAVVLGTKTLDTSFPLFLRLRDMEVDLTADQRAFIRRAVESGRFQRAEDAVREALSLWEERERKRAEILAAVDTAEASLAQGEGRAVARDSMQELTKEVKRRGRLRLDAKQQSPR